MSRVVALFFCFFTQEITIGLSAGTGMFYYSYNFFSHGIYLLIVLEGVHLSLRNGTIHNNGYVVISDIGTAGDDDTALLCITNRRPPTGSSTSGGDWFGPDGTRVPAFGSAVPGFRRNRSPMVVRLYRNTATDPPAEGIYQCQIRDDTETLQTLYVDIRLSNGMGNLHRCQHAIHIQVAFH